MRSIRQWWQTLCRMCWWGWKLRNSYDWDYGYLDRIIYLKLNRMQENMSKHGHCVWNSDPKAKEYWLMRKLEQAVYAAKIIDKQYEEPIRIQQHKNHEETWGEMTFGRWEEPPVIDHGFSKCTSIEQKDEAWKEYHAIDNEHAARMKQYRKHLHTLLYKYGRSWWD